MKKQYVEEFKKELVNEYIKVSSLNDLFIKYGISKSTLNGWVKKYSEECHYTNPEKKETNISAEELRVLNKKIAKLEKENNF